MLWIQGGAFVQLFNPNYNGSGLITSSGMEVIVVTFNYRVGPYGFLASSDLEREGNLNIGLHDQRTAMRWVVNHISQFGGDPKKITLFGTSVGGGSVLLQTLAYNGKPPPEDTGLWRAGIAAASFIPPIRRISDLDYQYRDLLTRTGCRNLSCLRRLESNSIQAANIGTPFPGQLSVPLFPYGPVIDRKLFSNTASAMLTAGEYARDKPLIIGSSHTEGTIFVPQANSTSSIFSFLQTQYPDLTKTDLKKANDLYLGVPTTIPGSTIPQSPLYYRLAKLYGDIGFSCPVLEFSTTFSNAGLAAYEFRDAISDPIEVAAGYGTPHTWEVQPVPISFRHFTSPN